MDLDEIFPGSHRRITAWAKLHGFCWYCKDDWALQTHHIQRRSSCYRNWGDVELNLFRTCPGCHETKVDAMSHAEQLAYKAFYDPDTFNLGAWLHCRDGPFLKAPERVTMEEVIEAAERFGFGL